MNLKFSQLKRNKKEYLDFLFNGKCYPDNLATSMLDFFDLEQLADLDECFYDKSAVEWYKDNILIPYKNRLYVDDPQEAKNHKNFVDKMCYVYVKRDLV